MRSVDPVGRRSCRSPFRSTSCQDGAGLTLTISLLVCTLKKASEKFPRMLADEVRLNRNALYRKYQALTYRH